MPEMNGGKSMKNMKETIHDMPDRSKQYGAYCLVMIALGLFIAIGHSMALDIVCKVIGVLLILSALGAFFHWWKNRGDKSPAVYAELLGTLVSAGLGIWCFFGTDSFVTFLNVILGLGMIISSLSSLSLGARGEKDFLSIILSCISLVLGFIVLFTHAGTTWMTIMLGLSLVFSGITGLVATKRNV